MTVGKATALTAGFLGAFAIVIGPSVKDILWVRDTQAVVRPAEVAPKRTPAPVATPTRVKPPRARANTSTPNKAAPSVMIPLSDPRLHDRVKPLLNRGARMAIAADGFRSADEFAPVAHAARKTSVPFMVLKHRV